MTMRANMLWLMAIGVTFCTGCAHDDIKDFIPGLYVREIRNEYTAGSDSLLVSVFDEDAHMYTVKKRSAFVQTIDKKRLPAKHRNQQWLAVYNESTRQLVLQSTGKALSFSPQKSLLIMGDAEYQKVK